MPESKLSTKLVFLDELPVGQRPSKLGSVIDSSSSLLIFDRKLERISLEFRAWAKSFPYRYGVESGEKLKDLEQFPKHVRKLASIAEPLPSRAMTIVAVGGGSIGDFAGFFASVYKRGVRLVHVPSTWLAAIDSSHGGKTALNITGAKNQIGTFYPADAVVLVRSLLFQQPEERVRDAMGELGKMALIDGGVWVKRLERTSLRGEELLWEFLKPAIEAKMKVVNKDPREISGARQVLNLGHTVGHVIEAALKLSHGASVAQGLFFALDYSERRGLLSAKDARRARTLLGDKMELRVEKKKIPERRFQELLIKDKKRSAKGEVTFIFLKKAGRTERVPVPVTEIVREARNQGWLK